MTRPSHARPPGAASAQLDAGVGRGSAAERPGAATMACQEVESVDAAADGAADTVDLAASRRPP